MILSFPIPYPDELLYSVFSRYHIRSGNTRPKITTKELFGKRSIRSVLDLPANLEAFLEQLNVPWDGDELIFRHTMYPYYAPFLLPHQAQKVKAAMLGSKGGVIHTAIGINASNVTTKTNLWVCNECIISDIESYGETYWHRVHQAPAVYFCPLHKVKLQETIIPRHPKNQHEYIPASPDVKRKDVNLKGLTEDDINNLIEIAQMTEKLLITRYHQSTNNTLRMRYLNELRQRGYASIAGFLKREKLYQSFQSRFSKLFLASVQSSVIFEESDWLTMIFQKHRKSFHPIRHLIVLSYLGIDLEELLEQEDFQPFGSAPWPCLNLTCVNYHKPTITSLKITSCSDTGKPIGTFECDCGFIFSRRGPDLQSSDRYKIGKIKNYGHTWLNELSELVRQHKKLSEISFALQADTATVKKYASLLGLITYWKQPKSINENLTVQLNEKIRLDKYKKKWLKLREAYPHKTRTELRALAPAEFAFLYRKDREWLQSNSPLKKKIQSINKRVDWEKRDKELLKQAQELIERWDSGVDDPTRITFTSIGKRLGKLSTISYNQKKLPKTIAYINEVIEDVTTYQIRRAHFVIDKAAMQGEYLKVWEVYQQAGLRSTVPSIVRSSIMKKLEENMKCEVDEVVKTI